MSEIIIIKKQRKQMKTTNNNSNHQSIRLHQDHHTLKLQQPTQQPSINYYQQFCKLYLTNIILNTQLTQLNHQKNQLIAKLNKIQTKKGNSATPLDTPHSTSNLDEKKKRFRRTASQIHRHYKCSVVTCRKSYGSQGSLNQHIKLKHPQLIEDNGQKMNQSEVQEKIEEDSHEEDDQQQDEDQVD